MTSNDGGYTLAFGDLHPFRDRSYNGSNDVPLTGTDSDYTPFFNVATTTTTTTTPMATTQKIPDGLSELPRKGKVLRSSRNGSESNLAFVSIEEDEYWISSDTKINVDLELPDVVEPEITDYDVDVLDDKNMWKPRLVFENKTETTTAAPSFIMRIGPKNTDVELFNIEAAPFQEGKLKIQIERIYLKACTIFYERL